MKQNKIVANHAGGIDLLTERDSGNPVRILTGSPEWSNKFWRSMKRLSEKALALIKSQDFKGEYQDEQPEWEALNEKLIEDNRTLFAALRRMKSIETHADGLLGKGIVDDPHTKAMRAMVQIAGEAINRVDNELYMATTIQ